MKQNSKLYKFPGCCKVLPSLFFTRTASVCNGFVLPAAVQFAAAYFIGGHRIQQARSGVCEACWWDGRGSP